MNVELPPDGTAELATMRLVSRSVFGGDYALETFTAMARSERFYLKELAEAVGATESHLSKVLHKLCERGLLSEEAPVEGQRRTYYRIRPSVFWTLVDNWAAEISQAPPSSLARVV
jgi:predicted transcriptional regulator